MLTFGKAGLDPSFADIHTRMDKQQIKELDELEHLQPYKWMMTQDQTKLLEDWVAKVLTQQSVTPEDQLLEMFISMEAEQASLPTIVKQPKPQMGRREGRQRREARLQPVTTSWVSSRQTTLGRDQMLVRFVEITSHRF